MEHVTFTNIQCQTHVPINLSKELSYSKYKTDYFIKWSWWEVQM